VPRLPLALLLVYIGFCEEAFWRGFVQGALREAKGAGPALALSSLLYASVHLWTLNAALVLLALFLGLIWGALFHATGSLALVFVSHAVWDELAFVVLPFAS
jgi:membrane protease YdiL (CAAX protease family)